MPGKRKANKKLEESITNDKEFNEPLPRPKRTFDLVKANTLSLLPLEVVRIITSYFSRREFKNCKLVNKTWNQIIRGCISGIRIIGNNPRTRSVNVKLDYLTKFPNLVQLDITGTTLMEHHLESIAQLTSVRKLVMYWNDQLDKSNFSKITNLENLEILTETHKLRKFEEALSCLPKLTSFSLTNTNMKSTKLDLDLSRLKKLEYLKLDGFHFPNPGADLTKLTNLTSLESAFGVSSLNFSNLTKLKCASINSIDRGSVFTLPTSITRLNLSENAMITNTYLPRLQYLQGSNLQNLEPFSAASVFIGYQTKIACSLSAMTNLTELTLYAPRFGPPRRIPSTLKVVNVPLYCIGESLPLDFVHTCTVRCESESLSALIQLTSLTKLSIVTFKNCCITSFF